MRFAWCSCDDLMHYSPGHDRMREFGPRLIAISGDYPYFTNNSGGGALWGVSTNAPTKGMSVAATKAHMTQLFAKPSLARLMALRRSGVRIVQQLDDHDMWSGNDWDHTLAQANSGDVPLGAVSQTEVNDHWWTGLQAALEFQADNFDNPAPDYSGNTERPPVAITGGANPPTTSYPIRYWFEDYAVDGTPGGQDLRIIYTDSISYRADRDSAETAAKVFLGTQQEEWLIDSIAGAAGHHHVFVCSTKELTKQNAGGGAGGYMGTAINPDTFGAYQTALERTLTAIQATGVNPIWLSGDKHHPHVMDARRSRGAAYDIIDICACPISVQLGGVANGLIYMSPGWRREWVGQYQCFGAVEIDREGARVSIRHATSGSPMWSARFAPRSNAPIYDAPATMVRVAA